MSKDLDRVVNPVLSELAESIDRLEQLMIVCDCATDDARVMGAYYVLQMDLMDRLKKAENAVRHLVTQELVPFARDMKTARLA